VVAVGPDEVAHLLDVGADVRLDEAGYVGVGDGLHPREQGHACDHALDVPGEVPEVGLVEVVDVEHEDPVAVHVGAEVLGVQVALDPDSPGPLVRPAVFLLLHVGVEQAGAPTVEGEGPSRHLPELLPERVGVGDHEVRESVNEHVHDLRLARLVPPSRLLGFGHVAPPVV